MVITSIWILQHPDGQRKHLRNFGLIAITWWSFLGLVRFFKVNGTWGLEGGVSRRMVKKQL